MIRHLTAEPWMDDALCTQTDPDLFFPEVGNNADDARRICSGCSVVAACLGFALVNNEREGIYGGLSPVERRELLRGSAA